MIWSKFYKYTWKRENNFWISLKCYLFNNLFIFYGISHTTVLFILLLSNFISSHSEIAQIFYITTNVDHFCPLHNLWTKPTMQISVKYFNLARLESFCQWFCQPFNCSDAVFLSLKWPFKLLDIFVSSFRTINIS